MSNFFSSGITFSATRVSSPGNLMNMLHLLAARLCGPQFPNARCPMNRWLYFAAPTIQVRVSAAPHAQPVCGRHGRQPIVAPFGEVVVPVETRDFAAHSCARLVACGL